MLFAVLVPVVRSSTSIFVSRIILNVRGMPRANSAQVTDVVLDADLMDEAAQGVDIDEVPFVEEEDVDGGTDVLMQEMRLRERLARKRSHLSMSAAHAGSSASVSV